MRPFGTSAILLGLGAVRLRTLARFLCTVTDGSCGRTCGRMTGLALQEDACSADRERQHRSEKHQRETVDQRDSDVEQDVFEAGACVFGEVLIRERYGNEKDQRSLDHRGEQTAVTNQCNGGDDTDDIEARKRRRQFGTTGRIDDESEKTRADGNGHCPPSRDTGHGRKG